MTDRDHTIAHYRKMKTTELLAFREAFRADMKDAKKRPADNERAQETIAFCLDRLQIIELLLVDRGEI